MRAPSYVLPLLRAAVVCCLWLTPVTSAFAQSDTVLAHQKISETAGGFLGALGNADEFGISVASIGDLDDDGVPDLAVGAYLADDGGPDRGNVWVLFLNADGTVKRDQKISSTAGDFDGVLDDFDRFGVALAGLGDLDGDGVEDLLVGAHRDDDGGPDRGAAWVLFLNSDGTVKDFQKISSTEGDFTGILADGDHFGHSVANLGDLDGDGVIDIGIGAVHDDDGGSSFGAVWILFMNVHGTVKAHQKISGTEGGFTGTLDASDKFGSAIEALGDLDGDGHDDIAVSAFHDGDGGIDRGAVWILFLNADGTVKSHQKISSTEGGFVGPLRDDDHLGNSMAAMGDLDGDGVVDLAVGAARDDDGGFDRGAVWILLLNPDGTVKGERKISDTVGGFEGMLDDEDRLGRALANLGDVNGDGNPDIAVGAHQDDDGGRDRGAAYVLFLGPIVTPSEPPPPGVPGTLLVDAIHPNPFGSTASFRFAASEGQRVRADLLDARGRVVAVLFDGVVAADEMRRVPISAELLTSGRYVVRLTGETFAESWPVAVVK